MKFLKFTLMLLIIICGLGYGVYHFGINFISNKVTDSVTAEIDDEEKLADIKKVINNNPEIKEFIEEGASVDESELPFTTKEEAIKTIVKNIGINELQRIQSKFQNGMSLREMQELTKDIEKKLTDEEILALKAIAYKELN